MMQRSDAYIRVMLPKFVRRSWEKGMQAGSEDMSIEELQICLQYGLRNVMLDGVIGKIARGDNQNTPLYANVIQASQKDHPAAPSTILDLLDTHAAGAPSYRIVGDIRDILKLPRQPHTPAPQEPNP